MENESKKLPRITLLGAGPGDPELITVKGVNSLRNADVVLYDALASKQLLSYCQPEAKLIFVGKRRSGCMYSQEDINTMMVQMAQEYGHVVRLKGGDPFVFGRGWEELDYARKYAIPVQLIPGVSSAIAVPELQQIPLTARGHSESFWVTTGTTRQGSVSADIALAAQSTATVVILMAMSKLGEIMQYFSNLGKERTPVAVLHKGTMPDEKVVFGTVSTIAELCKQAQVDNPSIVIVGSVVQLHPNWPSLVSSYDTKPK